MMDRIQMSRILCPVDFSAFSARALQSAAGLAQRFDARLMVLHIVPQTQSYDPGAVTVAPPIMANPVLCQLVRQDLARFVAEAIGPGAPVELVAREGEPWREILSVASRLTVDLIVMGTHGRGGFEYLLMGSVAQKVLSRASCPVITVAHEKGRAWESPGPVRNILCATDLTPRSSPTIRHALSLAAEFQCRLVLLHVIDRTLDVVGPGHPYAPMAVTVLNEHEAIARRQLHAAIPTDVRSWCTVDEQVVCGRPYEEILRVAAQVNADLIVVGAPQHGLARTVMGSTSQHIVRSATCPVLTVGVPEDAGSFELSVREGVAARSAVDAPKSGTSSGTMP